MGDSTTNAVLQLLRKHAEGVSEEMFLAELPSVTPEQRLAAMNSLLQKGMVQVLQSGATLIYKLISAEQAQQFKGLTAEDRIVYQAIQKSGTKGIWTRDMKNQTGLQQNQITKVIKTLEGRKLIKAVKSVASKNKKVYMLFELEPSSEVTGGSWYTDSNLDTELITAIRELCLAHVLRQGGDTLEGVVDAVRRAGAAGRDELAMQDYKQVLSTLVYDNEVELLISTGTGKDAKFRPGAEVYRPCKSRTPATTALTSVPCGICPVVADCCDGGLISPQTCVYFQDWLKF